jgi:hypothetical protein
VETPFVNPQAAVGGEPLRLVVSTALLRKNCDDGWTVGWGGRGETAKIVFANATGALTVGRACIDLGRTRVSGHATDARLSFNRCAIHLSPLRFAFNEALQASVTATLDPSTVEDCGKLLPQPTTALSGTVASARAAFNVRYEPRPVGPWTPWARAHRERWRRGICAPRRLHDAYVAHARSVAR